MTGKVPERADASSPPKLCKSFGFHSGPEKNIRDTPLIKVCCVHALRSPFDLATNEKSRSRKPRPTGMNATHFRE